MLDTFEEAVVAAEKLQALDVRRGKAPGVYAIMKHVGDSGCPAGDIKGTNKYVVWPEERAMRRDRDVNDSDRAFSGVAWVGNALDARLTKKVV